MALKIYADRMSQPSRAVLILCKSKGDFSLVFLGAACVFIWINGIDFEEIRIDNSKNMQFSPEFKAINPMSQVPAMVDGEFKLFESHAILIYICYAFPQVASHWYPNDIFTRSRIHSVLDWHHSNLHEGAGGLVFNTILAPLNGRPLRYPHSTKEREKLLDISLSKLEDFWLKDGPFLVGNSQPSIADISLVCEIMILELLSEKYHDWILSPYKKVVQWIEGTKRATAPHFDEVHGILFKAQKRIRELMATESAKNELKSKL